MTHWGLLIALSSSFLLPLSVAAIELTANRFDPAGPGVSLEVTGAEGDSFARRPEESATQTASGHASPAVIEGINLNENIANTGLLQIPPDPMGAAGLRHLVSVVNSSIEWHAKDGFEENSQSLKSFFSPLGARTPTFDPKVTYDPHEDRFVVLSLERVGDGTGDPDDASRILLAVSDNDDPNEGWHFQFIDAKELIGSTEHWADFPGLAVDEQAVYITANLFTFGTRSFGGSRLWILDKGSGQGGLYEGGASTVTAHDPSAGAGLPGQAFALQPAQVFGPAGVGPGVGTFLVNSGWTNGSFDFLSVIRVDDPLGAPVFTNQFVNLGNIATGFGLPDAPQAGTEETIETNDSRVINAVWQDSSLWAANTVNPPTGPDAGQATAHWYEIDTGDLDSIALLQQGDAGGEDIAPGTHTFFPSIAVDELGNMLIGFSGSAPSVFPGAYFAGRKPSDPSGTLQAAQTLAAGVDFYLRTLGSGRNRWGDYSSVVVDPADGHTFWIFNEYALERGTNLGGEDGRWGTRFGAVRMATCEGDLDGDGDVDEIDLMNLAVGYGATSTDPDDSPPGDIDGDADTDGTDLSRFGANFGRTVCP